MLPKKIERRKFLPYSSGQAVLLVVLGMAVVLTIVLSVASRSVTEVSVSEVDEASSQAFSAAEAGIEKLMAGSATEAGNFAAEGGGEFSAGADPYPASGTTSFDFNDALVNQQFSNGESATIWFVSHADDLSGFICDATHPCFSGNSLTLCWGLPSNSSSPSAIEVSLYYDTTGGSLASNPNFLGVKVKRWAFDGASSSRGNFSVATKGCSLSSSYSYSATISPLPTERLLFARVKFLYNNQPDSLAVVVNGGNLPSQGRLLTSTGTAAGATRKIQVVELYRSPLDLFEAGLFSPSDLSKTVASP